MPHEGGQPHLRQNVPEDGQDEEEVHGSQHHVPHHKVKAVAQGQEHAEREDQRLQGKAPQVQVCNYGLQVEDHPPQEGVLGNRVVLGLDHPDRGEAGHTCAGM